MTGSDRPLPPLIEAVLRRDVGRVIEQLLDGADPNTSVIEFPAPGWAVQEVSDEPVGEEIVRALLKAGADPSLALPRVAFFDDEPAVDALLVAGADVNARDQWGATALIMAAKFGHSRVLRRLCAAGARLEDTDARGRSALSWLARRGDFADAARVLVDSGANVNHGDEDNVTPLASAAYLGWSRTLDVLLAAGADPNLPGRIHGSTPLILAAESGHIDIVQRLLNARAQVDQTSLEGWTALMFASREDHQSIARLLIEHGADVSAVAKTGDTALGLARYNANDGLVR